MFLQRYSKEVLSWLSKIPVHGMRLRLFRATNFVLLDDETRSIVNARRLRRRDTAARDCCDGGEKSDKRGLSAGILYRPAIMSFQDLDSYIDDDKEGSTIGKSHKGWALLIRCYHSKETRRKTKSNRDESNIIQTGGV